MIKSRKETDMSIDEAIKLLEIEKMCVKHADVCNRECDKCALVQNTDKLLEMYTSVCELLKQLEEYQQLEEQGRLVKLPCKIGTKVYDITWWDDVQEKVVVEGKTYYRTARKHKIIESTFDYFDIKELGKKVFLTREEAEEKLKELRGA